MCGIYLKYLREPSNLEETKKRLESIRHRGPDDTRHVVHRNWFLGFTRLAIVSLNEQANQPLSNPNIHATNYLICNGEIYNYQSLKSTLKHETFSQSDCEVILHLLLQQDIHTVCNSLDGVFAFACIIENKLYLAIDPIGVRPLFYGKDELGFITVASEAKVLMGTCDQVKAFPPGCCASLQLDTPNQSVDIKSYLPDSLYNPPILYPDTELPSTEALTLVRNRLVDAVVKRTMTDRPVGMCLSGGLDSSLIAAILAKHTNISFTAFTIGMEGGDSPDVKAAECVADYLGKRIDGVIKLVPGIIGVVPPGHQIITGDPEIILGCYKSANNTSLSFGDRVTGQNTTPMSFHIKQLLAPKFYVILVSSKVGTLIM